MQVEPQIKTVTGGAEGGKAQQDKKFPALLKDQAKADSLEAGSRLMQPVRFFFQQLTRRRFRLPFPQNVEVRASLVSLRQKEELEINTTEG